jgi:hypothetical protein
MDTEMRAIYALLALILSFGGVVMWIVYQVARGMV